MIQILVADITMLAVDEIVNASDVRPCMNPLRPRLLLEPCGPVPALHERTRQRLHP